MPRKFKGKLNERIAPRSVNYLMPAERLDPILKKHFEEDWENLVLLCKEYNIPVGEGMYRRLTLALAQDFVPAFQEKKKTGPKSKWYSPREGALVVELERIRDEQNCTTAAAADKLALSEPWQSFLDARERGGPPENPGGTLRKQYNSACKSKSVEYHRTHLTNLREAYGSEKWESYLQEMFCGE